MKKVCALSSLFLLFPLFIFSANQIEINTASLEQLDELVKIGPALAQRIIDGRPYASIDDLLNVKGIGEKTLQEIKNQGLAYVSGQAPASTPTSTPISTPVASPPIETITYPTGVIINEILPSPDGADETNEFIEVYNTGNQEINITGWKLQDIQGTQTTYTFPANSILLPKNYLALSRPTTKILLNDTDSINLLFPDNTITSAVSYANAPTKQSYSKTINGWRWSTTPTPQRANAITAVTPKTKALPKVKKTDNKTNIASASGESINLDSSIFTANLEGNNQNPWWLFIITGTITVILGAIFLVVKLFLHKKQTI